MTGIELTSRQKIAMALRVIRGETTEEETSRTLGVKPDDVRECLSGALNAMKTAPVAEETPRG